MIAVGNPKIITVDCNGDFFTGTVEGTRTKWTFKSSSPLFLDYFPSGLLSLADITHNSPQAHLDIASDITKKGFFSL